jgi:hypothetical protein
LNFHARIGVAAGRSSDLQACPLNRSSIALQSNGASTNPSSRFFGKPVVLGCSFLLTAAGQFRFHTGFPLTFPHETSPANAPQHKVSSSPCQPKCCAFLNPLSQSIAKPRALYGVRHSSAAFTTPTQTPKFPYSPADLRHHVRAQHRCAPSPHDFSTSSLFVTRFLGASPRPLRLCVIFFLRFRSSTTTAPTSSPARPETSG